MSEPERPASPTLAYAACLVAVLGVSAVWGEVAALTRGQAAWIAVVAALDAALLLRLARWPAGATRAALAIGVTAVTIVGGNFFVATAQIGQLMGLRPIEAIGRMSLELAAMHVRANSGWPELAWYAGALFLAWRATR